MAEPGATQESLRRAEGKMERAEQALEAGEPGAAARLAAAEAELEAALDAMLDAQPDVEDEYFDDDDGKDPDEAFAWHMRKAVDASALGAEDDATPLDAALPLILPFASLQCKGRAQATSKTIGEGVVVDDLDARPLYAKLGNAKATALLPSLLTKHRLVALNVEFCRAASLLDVIAETQHASLKRLNLNAVDADPLIVTRVLGRCVRLEVVGLFRHVRLEDDALVALGKASGNSLRELSVSGCSLLTDTGIAALVAHAPSLSFLDATRCSKLTNASLEKLAPLPLTGLVCYANAALSAYGALRSPLLRRLDCTGSRDLTGVSIAKLARTCSTHLEVLNLSWCIAINDDAPKALGAHCPNLSWLSLHGNRTVTDVGMNALAAGCLQLRALDVSGCAGVTDYLRKEGVFEAKFPRVVTWTLHT